MEILVALLPVLLGVLGNFISSRINNASLTGAQREQNAYNAFQAQQQRDWSAGQNEQVMQFNSVEAEKNRAFQAQQAEQEMSFQRDMDNTVYQRRVADMRSAGINPALAIGGVSVAGGFGASGSGSLASASNPAGASASGSTGLFNPVSMSDLMQGALFDGLMEQLNSDIANKNADTLKKGKEAGLIDEQTIGQHIENDWIAIMRGAEYDKLMQDIKTGAADEALKRAGVSKSEAEEALTRVHKDIADIDLKYADQIKNLEMQYQTALTQYYTTQSSVAEASLGRIQAEITKIYEEAATERVYQGKLGADTELSREQSDYVRQQTATEANRTAEAGFSAESAEAKASMDKFNESKKEVRYNWEIAEKVIGEVERGVRTGAGAAGSVIGARTLKQVSKTPWFKRFLRHYSRGGGGRN